jgi:hypothetical protein
MFSKAGVKLLKKNAERQRERVICPFAFDM